MDLELRKTYLGATDLVAISGLSPWRKPGDVWLEKTGRSIGFEGNAATELGTDLEPIVALRHARRREKLGEIVQLGELPDPVFDKEFPFIAGNADRIYLNRKRVLECKTASESQLYDARYAWGEDGEQDGVPAYYFAQINHYIGALEFDDGFLSALFLGKGRIQRDYPIAFNRKLYDMLRQNGAKFWETYVVPNVQPPVEMFSPSLVMKALAEKAMPHGGKKGVLAEPDAYLESLADKYRLISRQIADLERTKGPVAGKIAAWITQHAATKVIHPWGSFTFQQPEPKKPVKVFDAENAWKSLHLALAGKIPAPVFQQIIDLTGEIQEKFTTEVTPESKGPTLHPYWKPEAE